MFTQIAATGASLSGPVLFDAFATLPFLVNAAVNIILVFIVLTFKETTLPDAAAQQLNLFDGIRTVLSVKPILIITCIDMLLLVFVNIFYQVLYFPKVNQLGVAGASDHVSVDAELSVQLYPSGADCDSAHPLRAHTAIQTARRGGIARSRPRRWPS